MKLLKQTKPGIRSGVLCVCALLVFALGWSSRDPDDHRIKPGETMPSYVLSGSDGRQINIADHKDKVLVMIYVVAKQRGSERAIADASMVLKDLNHDDVELIFVTANDEQREYFDEFWKEKKIEAPLAFDPDRDLYAKLGLIAFPSTLIVDKDGKLSHRLSTHSPNYPHVLIGYIQHALGILDDKGLEEHLKARSLPTSSPKSLASRHRAVAQLMRKKGMYETAEQELLKAIENDPESFDARLDLADLYLYIGKREKAHDYILQSLKHDPENRNAMLLEGIYQFRSNNFEKARKVLARALKLNPDPARTHYYLGRVYEAEGIPAEAMRHYREALSRLLDEPEDE